MAETNNINNSTTEAEPSPTKYGFSAARDFLVQKSRQNGNPVDVAKVANRTAKFERLEKEARRKSQPIGHVKSVWVAAESENTETKSGRPSFVKTFVSNTAPKKSMEELP